MVDGSSQQAAFDTSRSWVAVSAAILYYDYIITLPDEIRLCWSRKDTSGAALLFYACRYMALVGHLPIIYAAFASLTPDQCDGLQYYHQMFTGVSSILVNSLLIMRTYALHLCDRRVLLLLVIALIITTVLSTVLTSFSELVSSKPTDPTLFVNGNCKIILGQLEGYYCAGAWTATLLFDTVAFGLTLRKTLSIGTATVRKSLFRVMQRDGALYFCLLAIFYLINIVTLIFCVSDYKGLLITFTNVMAYTLTGRLMINIRSTALADVDMLDAMSDRGLSAPVLFARVSGSHISAA